MKMFHVALVFTVLSMASVASAARTYLGVFDFDTECRSAAIEQGFNDFQFNPLNGECYGISDRQSSINE